MNNQSLLYKELSIDEIKVLVQHHFNTNNILEIELLKGGMFNTTYRVVIDSPKKEMVLRVGPINRHLLLNFENHLMEAEEYVYQLCAENEIPTSKVIVCDVSKKVIDRDYMFLDYIKSISLSDTNINETIKSDLYEQAGKYISKLHKITNNSFGRVSDIVSGIKHETWADALFYEIEDIKQKSLLYNVFTLDQLKQIQLSYQNHQQLFAQVTEPHLVHADLWSGNILVSVKEQNCHVSAIIDADRAAFGDIDFEFASPWMINKDFIKGYGACANLISNDSDRIIKIKLYRMLFGMIDAYVWKAEYNNQANYVRNRDMVLKLLLELS